MALGEDIKKTITRGAHLFSEKTAALSYYAKLKWEQRSIQKLIEEELKTLGETAYRLHMEKRESEITDTAGRIAEKLDGLKKQLLEKEKELEELIEDRAVDKKQLKEFKKDLEMGDGAIEQIVIADNSQCSGRKLKNIDFPKNVLIGAIVRNNQVIIPDGDSIIEAGDKITILGEKEGVREAVKLLINQ